MVGFKSEIIFHPDNYARSLRGAPVCFLATSQIHDDVDTQAKDRLERPCFHRFSSNSCWTAVKSPQESALTGHECELDNFLFTVSEFIANSYIFS